MVIFSTLVYHCGAPRYMEPHILGWRPLMLRLIYFLFLRPSLMTSMCNLWPPLISLWPPLISLWQQHINIFLHFLLQRKTCCKSGDGGVSLSCRTSPCRLRKTDCRTENGDECKEGYRSHEQWRTGRDFATLYGVPRLFVDGLWFHQACIGGGAAAPYLHHMGVITRRTDDVRVSCCRVERLCRTGRRAGAMTWLKEVDRWPGGTRDPDRDQDHPDLQGELVQVVLEGGSPWGFTLKGGREHRERLIITKVEAGPGAGGLQVGDEVVQVGGVPLGGWRQEAIAMVKSAQRTLMLGVRRPGQTGRQGDHLHDDHPTDQVRQIVKETISMTTILQTGQDLLVLVFWIAVSQIGL
ncbi:unnamed protein product [Boreogadus saida]